ncbi:MAG: hypothetical protein P9M13_07225 [Candidatus Ancaeobacter aquaticus]|nr:hypothetical protein [Candidatus Ancaeobacter aquaticus]
MINGMDPIYNLWNLVFKTGKKEQDAQSKMRVPRTYKNKDEELSDIYKKQMALILDGPDRKGWRNR